MMSVISSIEDVSSSVTSREKLLHIIIDVGREYFNVLDRFILGMNPKEHSVITTALTASTDILERLSKGLSDVSLATLYKVYQDFDAIEVIISGVVLLLGNKSYSKAMLAEMSSGHHENMRANISRALNAYEKYLAMSREDDGVFSFAIKVTKAKNDEVYKFLFEHHEPNKLTMELIRQLLPVVTGDKLIFVVELINQQKNEIFGASRVQSIMQGHESIIYRYGLAPVTISMPMSNLFKTLEWKWDNSKSLDENLQSAASVGNNIVLLYRPAKSPIEFDFRGVLDPTFATTMPIKPYSGLNKNFVARYNTTTVLTNDTAKGNNEVILKPVTLYSAFIDVRKPIGFVVSRLEWTVIETINGIDYRAMNNASIGKASLPKVTGSSILGLLTGISSLPTLYNSAHLQNVERIHGDMFDSAARSHIDRWINYEKSTPSSDPIKNNVANKLEIFIRSQVGSITNNRDWRNLFVSDAFVNAASDAISEVLIKNSLIEKVKSPEYAITFVARVNNIIGKFIKSIDRALTGEVIPDRTFSEYSRVDLDSMLAARIMAVVKKAADLMDSDKIWTGHELTLKEFLIAY
jgi:hypothetical protein